MALERRAVQKHKRAMVCKVMQREGGGGRQEAPPRPGALHRGEQHK